MNQSIVKIGYSISQFLLPVFLKSMRAESNDRYVCRFFTYSSDICFMTLLRKDLPVKSKRGITMPNVFYNLLNKWYY